MEDLARIGNRLRKGWL